MEQCVIVVHGGAWAIPDNIKERSHEGVEIAAKAGWKVLQAGGSAVDAVEAAVISLENNPVFDAGYGSVLTDSGEVEMDALIMDGGQMRSGAVGAVSTLKNPVKLSRYIMEKTDHTLLVGRGAEKLAEKAGLDQVDPSTLVTPEARQEFETFKYRQAVTTLFSGRLKKDDRQPSIGHDTVGCVVLDALGSVAAATSTGGITGKMPGRVGDTPLVGAGGYADNEVGCVSTTGHGESITKSLLAYSAIVRMEQGDDPSTAGLKALQRMSSKFGGAGGLILINRNGEFAVEFSTERMAWAAIKGSLLQSGIEPNQIETKSISQ